MVGIGFVYFKQIGWRMHTCDIWLDKMYIRIMLPYTQTDNDTNYWRKSRNMNKVFTLAQNYTGAKGYSIYQCKNRYHNHDSIVVGIIP